MTLFEDYDKVHIGSVTKSQFHRVLSELELGGTYICMNNLKYYFPVDIYILWLKTI